MSKQNGDKSDKQAKGTRGTSSVLDLAGLPGLSENDANARLAREGPNELPSQKKRHNQGHQQSSRILRLLRTYEKTIPI
jgi:hypothetical protein